MEKIKISVNPIDLSDFMDSNAEFIPIVEDEGFQPGEEEAISKEDLPLLPLRNMVLFPGVIVPVSIGREKSLKLVRDVQKNKSYVGAVAQKNADIDEPGGDDLFRVGTMAKVLKVLEMPDGSTTVIIQGRKRFEWKEIVADEPYLKARVMMLDDVYPEGDDKREFEAVVSSLKDLSLRIIKNSTHLPPEAAFALKNIENALFLINYIGANTEIKLEEKQRILEMDSLKDRGLVLVEHLVKAVQLLEIKNDIQSKVKQDMDQQQREYLLHQQMKTIQDELGGNPVEQAVAELEEAAQKKKWGKEISDVFQKEIEKLRRLNMTSPEYSVQFNYLQMMLDLPWNEYTVDNFDLKRAERILDKDHYGLDNVKERILEHLAVLKLKGDLKSPILCLYGPPGVGKTSLGKSVAEALKRKYVRMSLGGLHDESEIRGHRKTYIGAMPGRIIHNIKKAGSSNPVFILDEIDKISNSFQGDPASALLEVLDPEQNSTFHDNYLDLDFDLSKVMFIATANTLNNISAPLLDRMELIEVSGYVLDEKVEIARRHLIPRQMELHGVEKGTVVLSKKVLAQIVEGYTRESGVRQLDKVLARFFRKIALKIAKGEAVKKTVNQQDVETILGVPRFSKDSWDKGADIGVVTGLAWTSVGGEILFVETSLSKGKGNLTLTGNLGDVMKESAVLALEYLKSHADALDIDAAVFEEKNVHVHVPEGAIPKDGPSAGVTMVTSMASAFTQRRVKSRLAMTGEITLRGRVLPVGGVKEKILAAKRAGVKDIILSKENLKDVNEIKDLYIEGLTFHYVETILEVLSLALEK
ncbi:endopeptidase La [Geofilum sp. OHC36d9]|uniref:endopeptidase La n=1 Tax=Geofilum sp. OHC36d9 TaxID=3458413 RepID=UPI004033E44E